MDTPITISSTLSSINKPAKSVSQRSRSAIARVPVSWESPVKPYDRGSNCTPSTLQKVNNWINSINALNRNNVDNNSSHNLRSDLSELSNGLDMEDDYLRRLKVSSDFSKSDLNEEKMIELELNQYCNETYSYEKAKSSHTAQHDRSQRKHSHPKAVKRHRIIRSSDQAESEIDKSDESVGDIPLSPESEKKKELCSYLQLMKPTDKKTVMILQNRRSVRVKNLSLMQERRELEKKLMEECGEENILKFPGLQDIGDVNVELREKWLQYKEANESGTETFHFPLPKPNLQNTITDFDAVIQEDWFKDWKTRKSKEQPISRNGNSSTSIMANVRTKNGKANLHIGVAKDESENNVKTRLGVKRTCLVNQENANKEKKIKNVNKTPPKKIENQQKVSPNSQKGYKIPNGLSNKQDKNGFKEKSNYSKRNSTESMMQAPKFVQDRVSIPRASLHLATGICDFGNVIQDNMDLIENSFVSIEPLEADKECKLIPVKTKVSIIKKKKKKPLSRLASENNGNIIRNTKALPSHATKSNPAKLKLANIKKEKRIRKTKSAILEKRSCFKIKLVSRKKNSVSPTKLNKGLNRSISEDLGASVHQQSTKEVEVSDNVGAKKVKAKEKVQSPKKSRNTRLSLSKSPVADTNENLLRPEDIQPPLSDQNLVLNEKSSRIGNLLNKPADFNVTNKALQSKSPKAKQPEVTSLSTIMAIFKDQSNAVSTTLEEKNEFYSQIINVEKSSDEESEMLVPEENIDNGAHITALPNSPKSAHITKTCSTPISSREELPQIGDVRTNPPPFTSFKKNKTINPLHRCLNSSKQKCVTGNLEVDNSCTNWPSGSPSHKQKKNQHSIHISKEHGPVLKIFYIQYNLVLCQESVVSLWTQTSLGNVLGAQNMWINKGSVQRLSMHNKCVFKESLEMVVSTDNSVAYIELWTKEHQSDIRESPVADVFATVYFWKKGHNGMDKKVLQLQNINGFADDVQYSVLKSTPKIVVSWHLASNELEKKKTSIHCYELAPDFQSVCNIGEFEAVEHYVSSLHNIEGCDTLIMGCGENKITLWNIEHGYVAATIEMLEIKSPLSTLWVKCDRGFLFTLQQCVDKELRLIAIHGMNHSWKKLASYVPPEEYDRLKGVCVENGIVLAFYDQGIVCWNAQTAETVLEILQTEAEYISGKYIISIANNQVNLRHAVTHLLSAEES